MKKHRSTPARKKARPLPLECTAYHEAGHAVVCTHLHHRVKRVSILPCEEDGSLGHSLPHKSPASFRPDENLSPSARDRIERTIMQLLAGHLAERKFSGRNNWKWSGCDRDAVADLASYVWGDDPELVGKYVDLLWLATSKLLDAPHVWRAVQYLAAALLERKEITGKEVRELYVQAIRDDFGPRPLA